MYNYVSTQLKLIRYNDRFVKCAFGIYMRIPMYSVMGGAPVGCSPRIKGGVPGRAIVKFFTFLYYGR